MTTEKITAPKVNTRLNEHLHDHEVVYNPKLEKVHEIVLGNGKGGLIEEVKEHQFTMKTIDERLEKIESGINKIAWAILAAILAAVLKLVIIG